MNKAIACFILFLSLAGNTPAIGQNKIIIRGFDWKIKSTAHFDIHYYDASEPWVEYAAGVLEKSYGNISADLKEEIKERKPFFLYASALDMQQSNIADAGDGTGGITEMFKDRFMVYSDGSREWLDNVITHELGHVFQFSVLLDGFWKSAKIIKTYVYPLWMMEGMAEHGTGQKDIAVEDMYMRDAATSGRLISLVNLHNFSHLKPHQTTLAYKEGGAAVRFLAAEYGEDKAGKMLRSFRAHYDISSVLTPLIGLDIFAFDKKFREYLEMKYARQTRLESLREPLSYGIKLTFDDGKIPEFNASPSLSSDGSKMAYISTREGHPPVIFVRDARSGVKKKFSALSLGVDNVPMGRFTKTERNLDMSPDGKRLVFSGQKNNRDYIYILETESGRAARLEIPDMMTVNQPRFSPDGKNIVFIGMKNGFNDIYILSDYTAENGSVDGRKIIRLTNDADDESSPSFSPDGKSIAYSKESAAAHPLPSLPPRGGGVGRGALSKEPEQLQESAEFSAAGRDIYLLELESGKARRITDLEGGERDPVFSPDGKRILFVGDAMKIFELYETELESGRTMRLTRTIGGNFTPAYSAGGREIYFASFRKGSMHIFKGGREGFLKEEVSVSPARPPERAGAENRSSGPDISKTKEYKFSASTDLFFPAFFFSSQGGLYWTNYWQGSDMLGNHQAQMMLTYNSGSRYLNYQTAYSYTKFRPQFFVQAAGYMSRENIDYAGLIYRENTHSQAVGALYPFDRYHSFEIGVFNKREILDFPDLGQEAGDYATRAVQAAVTRDTVNGRYLVATRGNRLKIGGFKAFEALGGNQEYITQYVEAHQYVPIKNQSALAFRFLEAGSYGPDRRVFELGGIGWARGFQRSSFVNTASRFVLGTAEIRFPIVQDMNYYMWYIFPDFYFKAIFASVFTDSVLGWDTANQLKYSGVENVKNSVGVGIQIHTFIMQTFPMVLTFDYAVKTNNGGRVLYFYLGPLF